MSYNYVFSDYANKDMDSIEEYLAQFYPSTSLNFISKVEEKISLLLTMPYMYPEYENYTYFRRMNVDDYLFFYTIDDDKKLIAFHRIIHSSREINKNILNTS
jgi:addiction module RelE/StbE family toxin